MSFANPSFVSADHRFNITKVGSSGGVCCDIWYSIFDICISCYSILDITTEGPWWGLPISLVAVGRHFRFSIWNIWINMYVSIFGHTIVMSYHIINTSVTFVSDSVDHTWQQKALWCPGYSPGICKHIKYIDFLFIYKKILQAELVAYLGLPPCTSHWLSTSYLK